MNRVNELKAFVNTFYDELDSGLINLNELEMLLENEGITPNMHVGRGEEMKGDSYEAKLLTIEWYLGSLLSIIRSRSFFAMNSWLNCKERFCDNL